MFLRQVAERHNNNSRQDLRHRGINMELLYEELDEDIVQQQADNHQQKIPEQLYPPMQRRLREHHIPHQEKPHWKTYTEGNENRSNMGLDDKKTKVDIMFVQDKIIPYRIHHNICNSIRSPACRITKRLQGHYPAE